MKSSLPRVLLWAVLCFAVAFFNEVAGASLRARKGSGGGDDDDDGGGMGGALMGLMGGAGGGDGDGDDDDANMVGGHKKGSKGVPGSAGGVDVNGLESSLNTGGVGGLMKMLTAMRAAQGQSDTHIKKGKHGEEMYDFRDLDDSSTTMMPIVMTEKPPTMAPPPMVEMPSMPTISLPGKGGKIQGLAKAQADARKQRHQRKKEAAVAAAAAAKGPHGEVVWGADPVTMAPPMAPVPVVQQVAQVVPQVAAMPYMAAPQAMAAPLAMAPVAGNAGLVQSLAAMRQNMDMLMSQAMGMPAGAPRAAPPAPQADNGALTAKLDEMSTSFHDEESKMEKKIDALEGENADMKKQMGEQAVELKAVEEAAKQNKASQGEVHKATVAEAQDAKRAEQFAKAEAEADKKTQVAKAEAQVVKKASVAAAVVAEVKTQVVEAKTKVAEVKAQVVAATTKVVEAKTKVVEAKTQVVEAKKATKVKLVNAKSKAKAKQTAVAYATKPWEATFSVHLDGKEGGHEESFTVRVHPEWAPEGAKRFQDMLSAGILDEARFFRVVPGFMVQFGIAPSPKVASKWEHRKIQDDPVKQSNKRGMMTFATSGPNTRTTQMFINYANNDFLDKQNFAPFAEVVGDGMKVVERIQSKYKEKPNQSKIQHHGNKYLKKHFPELSFVGHVASTLAASSAPAVAGLIQDSKSPVMAPRKSYRYGNIATFYHHKVRVGQ